MIWKRNIIPLSAIYPLQREQQRGDEDVGSKDDERNERILTERTTPTYESNYPKSSLGHLRYFL